MAGSASCYRIQFQKGLGLAEFQARFGSEQQCRDALFALRWPDGFRCPRCRWQKGWQLARPLVKCARCRHEVSLTSGTLFHATKLRLQSWFLAVYLFTQTKTGLSTLELKRHLGVNEKTAWLIQHKLMETMRHGEGRRRLSGCVEFRVARYPGRHGAGRKGTGNTEGPLFIVAAQRTGSGGISTACVEPVPSLRVSVLRDWARRHLAPDTEILTHHGTGLRGLAAETGSIQRAADTHKGRSRSAPLFWTATLLSNLQTALAGVRHDPAGKYRARYLALFQFRLNHRFDLGGIARRTLALSALSPPRPRRVLEQVEIAGKSRSGRARLPADPASRPGSVSLRSDSFGAG
jgi:hypothetical protein